MSDLKNSHDASNELLGDARRTMGALEREVVNVMARATSIAALNAAHARGRNQRKFADQLAVDAMRRVLHRDLPLCAEVVIGEGVRDEAPMLYIGERLGPESADGKCQMTIAVDPLEGTNLCARGEPGAITVIAGAVRGEGQLLGGIDGYFDKVVVAKDLAQQIQALREGKTGDGSTPIRVDEKHGLLDNPVQDIVRWICQERNKSASEVVAMVLERERNQKLVHELRALNTQVLLIRDGDITAGLLAVDPDRDIDIAIGIGAAPEGVITAAITKAFQGYMEARWWLDDPKSGDLHRAQLQEKGVDPQRLYRVDDLAQGHVLFALTGVTYNQYTPGVQYQSGGSAVTHTIYGRSRSGTIYERRAIHQNPPPQPQFPPLVDSEE